MKLKKILSLPLKFNLAILQFLKVLDQINKYYEKIN